MCKHWYYMDCWWCQYIIIRIQIQCEQTLMAVGVSRGTKCSRHAVIVPWYVVEK